MDVNRNSTLNFMQFCGCMSLLNLDLHSLCGLSDRVVFNHLADATGCRVDVKDLLTNPRSALPSRDGYAPTTATSRSVNFLMMPSLLTDDDAEEERAAKCKWSAIAKWLSANQLRNVAIRRTHYEKGWRRTAQLASSGKGHEEAAMTSEESMDRSATGKPGSAGSEAAEDSPHDGAIPRPRCRPPFGRSGYRGSDLDSISGAAVPVVSREEALFESAAVMREQDRYIHHAFADLASVKGSNNVMFMTQMELIQFFADLPVADPALPALQESWIGKQYDEAIEVQKKFTKLGSGLSLRSLKVILCNFARELGLHWLRLIECMGQSQAGLLTPSQTMFFMP